MCGLHFIAIDWRYNFYSYKVTVTPQRNVPPPNWLIWFCIFVYLPLIKLSKTIVEPQYSANAFYLIPPYSELFRQRRMNQKCLKQYLDQMHNLSISIHNLSLDLCPLTVHMVIVLLECPYGWARACSDMLQILWSFEQRVSKPERERVESLEDVSKKISWREKVSQFRLV